MNHTDLLRITALTDAQQWDAALAEIDRLLASRPGDPSLRSQRAFVLLNLGRNEEALTAAEHALAVQPTGVWPQLLRATALRFLGRRGDALAAAEQVAASAPHDSAVRLELARCQLAARKRKQAEQTAMAVVADFPTSVAGWIEVGQARLGRNNPAAADAFQRALAIDPTSAVAVNGLGAAYQRMGKRADAATMYTQAARLAPREAAPRRNLEGLVGFGGLAMFGVVVLQVLRQKPLFTALVVIAILAALAIPVIVVVRRRRLNELPPDARAYVESQSRARWRRVRDPRNWPGWVRANPRQAGVLAGALGLFVVAATFGSDRREERNPRLDFDLEDFKVPTISPTSAPSVILHCADGSTVPLRPGADISECDDYTVVARPPVRPVVSEVGSSPDAGQDRGSATAP